MQVKYELTQVVLRREKRGWRRLSLLASVPQEKLLTLESDNRLSKTVESWQGVRLPSFRYRDTVIFKRGEDTLTLKAADSSADFSEDGSTATIEVYLVQNVDRHWQSGLDEAFDRVRSFGFA